MIRDMTSGNTAKHLIHFSIPFVLGNMLQLTYNAVDSIIIGRFAGKDALAAVGTSTPIINILILGISGICIGASVLMSELFGAGNEKELKKAVSTTLLFGGVFSILIMTLGLIFAPGLLRLLGVPQEIMHSSTLFLRISLTATPFIYWYNAVSAAMRSVGDSKTPIRFLAIASVLNACLDLLFVAVLDWGVAGAALGTNIAEACSAIFCMVYIYRKVPLLRLGKADFRFDRSMLDRILRHGSVTALQQSAQPIGKLIIQGVVNPLGVDAIAAFNAVNRVDDFAFTPQQSISHGMMTFVAQNRGAKKKDRVLSGLKVGLKLEFCYWILIGVLAFSLKEPIMRLFVKAEDVSTIQLGVDYLKWMALFYLFPAFTNGIQGFFRGMGNMKITLLSTLIQITTRVIFVLILVPHMGLNGTAYANAIGWTLMLAYEVPYYFRFKKRHALLQGG